MFGFRRRSRRIRELEAALQWYADETHWRRKATNPKGSPRRWSKSPAARDRGARARDALVPWSRRLFQAAFNRTRSDMLSAIAAAPAVSTVPTSITGTGLVNNAVMAGPPSLIPEPINSGIPQSAPSPLASGEPTNTTE